MRAEEYLIYSLVIFSTTAPAAIFSWGSKSGEQVQSGNPYKLFDKRLTEARTNKEIHADFLDTIVAPMTPWSSRMTTVSARLRRTGCLQTSRNCRGTSESKLHSWMSTIRTRRARRRLSPLELVPRSMLGVVIYGHRGWVSSCMDEAVVSHV
ncbi:hypothetical protein BU25DRAFT_418790 [Macroventuria anomochaeta]|uniref:Uncharacterized protein n=1 Tax=Macroventuria anomochaeta TaxID=301207 RepID=A0ACB6SAV2_9PLEO|nr:uncharacterized protein BU25DRAFT_418790 [Macroventuria anomochaeta]KAF2631173.1 hypothetical protein BU25DRAFT_418790 [Macroventuria anomochaeta]